MRTKKQMKALEQAQRYKSKNYLTEHFGKQYLAYCDDGYVEPHRFLGYVNDVENVIPIRRVIRPAMDFDQYLDVVVRQAKRIANG